MTSNSRRDTLLTGLVFATTAVLCVANLMRRGFGWSPDSAWYRAAGEHLLQTHFNLGDFYRTFHFSPPPFCYTVLVVVVALAKCVAPHDWRLVVVALNILSTATATTLVFKLTKSTFGGVGGAVGAVVLMGSFDVVDWSRYVMTESLFLGLSTAAFYLIATAVLRADRRRLAWAAVVIAVALFTRPVAPLLLPTVAAGMYVQCSVRDASAIARRLRRAVRAAVWGAPAIVFAGVIAVWMISAFAPNAASLQFVRLYRSGVVVIDRPEMNCGGGASLGAFLTTFSCRLAAFFQISSSGFSPIHNVVALLEYPLLYSLACWGAWALFRRRQWAWRRQLVAALALTEVLSFWLFQSLIIIDFDWRYRLPVMPALAILAAAGAMDICAGLQAVAARAAPAPASALDARGPRACRQSSLPGT
jgi:4-amino-4-deoxy-L-arabinose transferase-like glycosyltransferase